MIEMKSKARAALALGAIALGGCQPEERADGIVPLQQGEVLRVTNLHREAFVIPRAMGRLGGGVAYEQWEHVSFNDQNGRSVRLNVGPLEIYGYVVVPKTWKPPCLNRSLRELSDGDSVRVTDAGATIDLGTLKVGARPVHAEKVE